MDMIYFRLYLSQNAQVKKKRLAAKAVDPDYQGGGGKDATQCR